MNSKYMVVGEKVSQSLVFFHTFFSKNNFKSKKKINAKNNLIRE